MRGSEGGLVREGSDVCMLSGMMGMRYEKSLLLAWRWWWLLCCH